jgi:Tol biopolymer transport system component
MFASLLNHGRHGVVVRDLVRIQLTLVLALVITASTGAEASLAGTNQRILFVTTRDSGEIYAIEGDGTGEARVTRRDPNGFGAAWSPDGSTIAFTGGGNDDYANLWVMARDGSDPHPLVGLRWLAEALFDPDYSPNGARIVFSFAEKIYTVRADGTGLRRLTGGGRVGHEDWDPAWSPAGGAIAFTRDSRIYCMRPDGTRKQSLGPGDQADWSPNGEKIVFAVWQRNGRRDLYVMNADGSNRRRLTHTRADESRPAWSPRGGTIAFNRGGSLWLMHRDGSDAHRIARNAWAPAWAPGGRWLAFSRGKTIEHLGNPESATAVFTLRKDGTGLKRLLTPEFDRDVAPSPDGTKIAFTSVRPYSQSGVYVADADGTNEALLHTGEAPAWSPDSSTLILQDADGLYTINPDGSSATKLPAPTGAHDPAWRPDGLAVSFVARAGGCSDVYTMALDGTNLTRATDESCYPAPDDFAWAPDGTSLVFSGPACDFDDGCETDQIFSTTVPGGAATALTGPSPDYSDTAPSVSPDGMTIAFERWDWRGIAKPDVWIMDIDGTDETKLTSSGADRRPSWVP